jgi:dTDP-4-amino-4,6-dideoxygalactose transaminase
LTSASRDIPFGRPWITDDDRAAVAEALSSPILTHGPHATAFEREFEAFLGEGAHCVSVSSCAAALHLAYTAAGVGPGDEVVLPAQTHVATANTAEWVGATSVFVDCDPATGNVTAEAVEAAITPRTKAIAVVHFVGIPCDMPSIAEVARARGLALVEDCALAVGARVGGRHVGLWGDYGCFSFYPVKHLTTAEGGMLVTRTAEEAERVGRMRAHGVERAGLPKGYYELGSPGLNYRISELQAALGRSQLRRVEEILERRSANFERIQEALRDAPVRVLDGPGQSWYCLSMILEDDSLDRDGVIAALNAAGVGTSIYYPAPVPRMRHYRERYGYDAARYPNAEAVSDRGIALPVGQHLRGDDADYVAGQAVLALAR